MEWAEQYASAEGKTTLEMKLDKEGVKLPPFSLVGFNLRLPTVIDREQSRQRARVCSGTGNVSIRSVLTFSPSSSSLRHDVLDGSA